VHVTAQEYAEIMNLYSLYNFVRDSGNPSDLGSCFTKAGEMFINGSSVRLGRETHVSSKQADQQGSSKVRQHWISSIHLEKIAEDRVRGSCYVHVFDNDPGQPPQLVVAGTYSDIVVKEAGEWKFARRDLSRTYRNL
jgi:SnoaL-like domain